MKDWPVHYRYSDYSFAEGVEVKVSKFYPIRETPCFYIVIDEFEKHMKKVSNGREPRTRRVSKDGLRRYCYPTKQEALNSFKARKRSQISHCQLAFATATQALKGLATPSETPGEIQDCIKVGRPDYFDNLFFE